MKIDTKTPQSLRDSSPLKSGAAKYTLHGKHQTLHNKD